MSYFLKLILIMQRLQMRLRIFTTQESIRSKTSLSRSPRANSIKVNTMDSTDASTERVSASSATGSAYPTDLHSHLESLPVTTRMALAKRLTACFAVAEYMKTI